MMKKTIYILVLILVIILFPLTVNTVGIDVKLTSEEQEYNATNETDSINLKNNKTDSDIAQKESDIKIIAGEKAINTTVSKRNNDITLPNAGKSTWLVVIIVILILLMILFKFKSRKIKY